MSTTTLEHMAGVVGELHWRPSPLSRALATSGAVSLAVAIALTRADLLVFAAPLLGVLAAGLWQRGSGTVRAHGDPEVVRCFESETMRLRIGANPVAGLRTVRIRPEPTSGLEFADGYEDGWRTNEFELSLCARRWGNYPVGVRVEGSAPSGLLVGDIVLPVATALVYPLVSPRRTGLPEVELPDRLGTHLTRRLGPGTEYADIRVWVPGDQLRSVNWPVSARRGRLHVTERLTDRAADVVAVVDTYPQPTGPATEALDRAVRGAVQVVQTALQEGDRAGVVSLGRPIRWLSPDIGRRQFYRVLDAVLASADTGTATGTLAPRFAVPPGAVVIAFSTLLDTQFALALIELRRRGHKVVAVDVLAGTPFDPDPEPILAHLWRLERSGMRRDLGVVGVDVVAWAGETELDAVMRMVTGRAARPHRRSPRSRR
ncbi:DUF58 domain-containing protein [Aldersonia kunmingensis]|uniref:DUF58 domain-containing protein n=1 Tax=Aldersonia kunmingensis TaxID=408066 RepID=UPI000A411023|nr:DUF58 domain-containing protein [Aldersonia kunmingensis]